VREVTLPSPSSRQSGALEGGLKPRIETEEVGMAYPACPLHMPVPVTNYVRYRFGRWERVRAHCRGLPRR